MRQKPTKEKQQMFLQELFPQFRKHVLDGKPVPNPANPNRPTILAKTTARNYLCRVERFIESLGDNPTVAEITRQSVLKHLSAMQKISKICVHMHYAATHLFCRWLISQGWLRSDPCDNIPLPPFSRKRRTPIPEDLIPRLMDACDRLPANEYRCLLYKAALSLLVYGAMRSSEVSGIRVEDVRLDTGEVYIRNGKGNKPRTVYVCRECIDAVKAFLKVRVQADHDLLLAQTARYGMMPHALRSMLRTLHRIAGIDVHYTPHQLRHACASRLLNNGAPITAIQAFLGHSRPEITFHYLHSSEQQLKDIAHLTSLTAMPPRPADRQETPKTAPTPQADNQKERKRFHVRRLR